MNLRHGVLGVAVAGWLVSSVHAMPLPIKRKSAKDGRASQKIDAAWRCCDEAPTATSGTLIEQVHPKGAGPFDYAKLSYHEPGLAMVTREQESQKALLGYLKALQSVLEGGRLPFFVRSILDKWPPVQKLKRMFPGPADWVPIEIKDDRIVRGARRTLEIFPLLGERSWFIEYEDLLEKSPQRTLTFRFESLDETGKRVGYVLSLLDDGKIRVRWKEPDESEYRSLTIEPPSSSGEVEIKIPTDGLALFRKYGGAL